VVATQDFLHLIVNVGLLNVLGNDGIQRVSEFVAHTCIYHAQQPILHKLLVIVHHCRHINELQHLGYLTVMLEHVHLYFNINLLVFLNSIIFQNHELFTLKE